MSEIMDCERTLLTHFHGNKMSYSNHIPPFEVNVLVVDGDAASLEITLGLLAALNYKAEGSKHPLMALERVRKKEGYYDLIVIEPHLPDIDGFQFKHKLDQQFSIPFIMMSMCNDERVMEKAMKSGVVRYIVKPATVSDFKGIWQYAVPSIFMKANKKKPSSSSSPPSPFIRSSRRLQEADENCSVQDSWSPINTGPRKDNRIVKRKEFVVRTMKKNNNNAASEGGGGDDNGSSSLSRVTKKSKVVWTSDLQSRFLEAINIIGLENAVPKKILEVMQTPGLTRENVASHLQKYRLFLKRVARMFAMVMNNETENNKDVFSSMASKYPNSLMLKNIKEEFRRMLKIRKLRASSSSSSQPYSSSSSYKNPNNNPSNPSFKLPSNHKFQSHHHHSNNFPKPHHHHSTNFSSTQIMNPYGLLHDHQIPASSSSSNFNNNNFSNNNAGLLGFPGVSLSNYYDYFGNNNSFNIINGSNNYGYLVDGRVSPAASNEFFRANQSLLADMEGNIIISNNNNNNILENNNVLEQQEKQYGVLNNEGHCYETVGGNNNCSNFFSTGGFDCGNNFIMREEDNDKFSNQQQDNQEVVGKDIDPRLESNDDYFPSFEQISNQMLETLNLSEKDFENLEDLDQIPQDWDDDFLESLLNNGL